MVAVATRPAPRARPPRQRRYVTVGSGGREADLAALASAQASQQGPAAPVREERELRGGRRPRREAPAPAVPARRGEVEEALVEEPLATADADEVLAYEFLASLIEELPDEDLPESRDEIEEEVEDLARLAETIKTPLFSTAPAALRARAHGVVAQRQEEVADLLHEARFDPEEGDEQGEEVAPGLFELADGRLVDADGIFYVDADDDPSTIGPVVVDEDGNRYAVDDETGLIPLSAPAPERDERGRFLRRNDMDATAGEIAATQQDAEPGAEPGSESTQEPE